MEPTPNDLIAGACRVLRTAVAPDVGADRANGRLTQVVELLGAIDWNEVGYALLNENDRYAGLIDACLRWISTEPGLAAAAGSLRAARVALARAGRPPLTHAQALAANRAGRRAVCDLVAALEAAGVDPEPVFRDASAWM